MDLPEAFLQQMKNQLGEELAALREALCFPPPVSIRLNSEKKFTLPENIGKVKWNYDGVYLKERPSFTLDPLFHAGAYYVQEASSMFIAEAYRQLFETGRDIKVLDLCAAPGGKSSLLASVISKGSLLLANEVIKSRYSSLRHNLVKWGYSNTHSSNHDSRDFRGLKNFFDLVLVDAPCSGEGLFRKDPKAMEEWGSENIQLCVGRQKRILADAVQLVKAGGILIYCTCTYNERENEQNVQWLKNNFPLYQAGLQLSESWGIVEKEGAYRFYPHKVKGEGFFLACFRKEGAGERKTGVVKAKGFSRLKPLPKKGIPILSKWIKSTESISFFLDRNDVVRGILSSQLKDCQILDSKLSRLHLGFEMGKIIKDELIPSPTLALHTSISSDLAAIELDREQALRYLRKDSISLETSLQGWALARFQGHNLGWIKVLKNRINNYYPKGWRILRK